MFGQASGKPAFGASTSTSFGFGTTPITSTTTPLTFGSTAAKPTFAFGQSATQAPSTGFGFGQPATSSYVAGFGIGQTASASSTTAFGFAQAAPSTTSSAVGFGQTVASTASTGFGFGQTAAAGGFGFGQQPTSTGQTSSFGFGSSSANKPAFGFGSSTGFGSQQTSNTSVLGGTSGFASLPTNQPTQPATNKDALFMTAVHMPVVFNDERDGVLMKWNQLQAFWGTGKGIVSQTSSIDFTSENPFCYFKAVGFGTMPKNKDEDGLVAVIVNKSAEDLRNNQQASVNFLSGLLGNAPTLSVCVDSIKELPDSRVEMVIYVQERLPTGSVRRVPASQLNRALCQPSVEAQLKNAMVEQIIPKACLSPEALKFYLDTPPAGIDRVLWEQAIKDNPDSDSLLPVPMVGFPELLKRTKHQEHQCSFYQSRLDVIHDEIKKLQQNHATTASRIDEYKRRLVDLSHRVLKVVVKQEVHRKMGYSILADEEVLRIKLEKLQQELNAPTQFKSRLSELLSQIRLQSQPMPAYSTEGPAALDKNILDEIKAHLESQHEGLQQLVGILKEDLADLAIIEGGYTDVPLR